jgi:hypothetical protein
VISVAFLVAVQCRMMSLRTVAVSVVSSLLQGMERGNSSWVLISILELLNAVFAMKRRWVRRWVSGKRLGIEANLDLESTTAFSEFAAADQR